jgi:hypothetical protein
MFGQLLCVGIVSLHLDPNLLDSLATKAQLNCVVQYNGMVDAAATDKEMDAVPAAYEEADGEDNTYVDADFEDGGDKAVVIDEVDMDIGLIDVNVGDGMYLLMLRWWLCVDELQLKMTTLMQKKTLT